MTTKHTLGPWEYRKTKRMYVVEMPQHKDSLYGLHRIAEVPRTVLFESEANAVLIATAPELLEALIDAKQLLDALRMDSGVGEILTDSQRELYASIDAKVTAAIAKAEGRTT